MTRNRSHWTSSCLPLLLTLCFVSEGCENGEPLPNVDSESLTKMEAWFEDQAETRGVHFVLESGHHEGFPIPETICGGAALLDMDNDGDLDIYLVQAGSLESDAAPNPPNRLYRNDGPNGFTDVTEGSGAGDQGYGMGVATGDFDNDGDIDLYVTNLGRNTLLRNDGNGHFTDVTESSGTGDTKWGASAAFLDYDRDGHLDLYITNYLYWSLGSDPDCIDPFGRLDYCSPLAYDTPAYDTLYHNNGDGTFTDVSTSSGIDSEPGNGLGIVCEDFNGDGFPDIFVANDGMKNILWQNQGNGTFKNVAMTTGCALDHDGHAKAGMGIAIADVDDDGDFDLLVVNLANEADSFYQWEGSYFTERAAAKGLTTFSRKFTRFGTGLFDFDNDGHLDIYHANGRVTRQNRPYLEKVDAYAESNLLYRGLSDGTYLVVSPRGGTATELVHVSRAAAFGDFDNDGGLDILVANRDERVYLLRNVVPMRGAWIGFRLLNEHGSDAIGAVLTCRVGDRTVTRSVRTASSYLAASDPRIHIGLGDASAVDEVSVRWPDGTEQRLEGPIQINRYVEIRRETNP